MQAEALCTSGGAQLQGPLLLRPRVYGDARGFFLESWNQLRWSALLAEHGAAMAPGFVQDNHSRSEQGVLRGLHYQVPPHSQSKLVRCVVGEIFDVAVDLRRQSPAFRSWVGVHLSAENLHQLWLPEGFAHGFLTLSERADVLYKTTGFWDRECERSIRWDDPDLAIAWPDCGSPLQLSAKDQAAPWLESLAATDLF